MNPNIQKSVGATKLCRIWHPAIGARDLQTQKVMIQTDARDQNQTRPSGSSPLGRCFFAGRIQLIQLFVPTSSRLDAFSSLLFPLLTSLYSLCFPLPVSFLFPRSHSPSFPPPYTPVPDLASGDLPSGLAQIPSLFHHPRAALIPIHSYHPHSASAGCFCQYAHNSREQISYQQYIPPQLQTICPFGSSSTRSLPSSLHLDISVCPSPFLGCPAFGRVSAQHAPTLKPRQSPFHHYLAIFSRLVFYFSAFSRRFFFSEQSRRPPWM